jgi:hypothetical protein
LKRHKQSKSHKEWDMNTAEQEESQESN